MRGSPVNRQQFEALIAQEIEQTIAGLLPNDAQIGRIPSARLRSALEKIAQRTETAARDYYLSNLRTVDDLAAEFGISKRRAQTIAQRHHARWGKGMKIGGSYVFSADEIATMRPADKGRPSKAEQAAADAEAQALAGE